MKLRTQTVIVLGLIALIVGCSSPKKEDGQIRIVATTGIIADCLQNIVGDRAEVISIMGPGVDPHLYKASQGDLVKLSKADVIVYNGLHLEGKMGMVLKSSSKNKPTLAVGDYADRNQLKAVDETSDLKDPHIWFDPVLWMDAFEGLVKDLAKIKGLEGIEEDFALYRSEVESVNLELIALLDSSLSQEQRILITSHDAFSYFGEAYGFEVRGLQGISTAAEFGVKDVSDLIDFIIQNQVYALFVETSVSDKNLRSVAEGAAAKGFEVNIGGTLYSDALGEDGSEAGTYKGMIRSNIQTIIEGLKL